ncbi:MAG: hypothetical protein ABIT07_08430 [Ferruginibacter sp.]
MACPPGAVGLIRYKYGTNPSHKTLTGLTTSIPHASAIGRNNISPLTFKICR